MFSLLVAVVWSRVDGDKQLLGTGLCIFRVPRLLPEWCHQCCRMANCDEMRWPLQVRPFLGEVLCVLLCLYLSQPQSTEVLPYLTHTHKKKCEWLLAQLPPILVLSKQSSLCCSSLSPWKKRWALAMISAVNMSWPDLGTTQAFLFMWEFHFTVGLRGSIQVVHFSDHLSHMRVVRSIPWPLCLVYLWSCHCPLTPCPAHREHQAGCTVRRSSEAEFKHNRSLFPVRGRLIAYLPLNFSHNITVWIFMFVSQKLQFEHCQSWQIPRLTCSCDLI